ncbi:hypothetical protein LPTSP3_g08180 [Leptospira kobayashii]|uniref:Tetratricopeptide repeat protein n=1 Tax=Leptospira kobayashii TaxID=1917830 RepID=A0ABN6KAM4_9LEPT|nr:hypothetical protein [Leptospira kobayashii]BDA77888.1 hypothetical protein LPTSP3_g08180 [Leptospira kobayashii]
MDKFVKKNLIDKKREEEVRAHKDEFADFEGTKSELYFLKFSHFFVRNRRNVFLGIGAVVIVLAAVIGYFEYSDYRFQKETVVLEDLQSKAKKANLTPEKQIAELETFLKDQSTGRMELRVWKDLSRLYAEKGDFTKAAEYIELAGKKIDTPKEIKAYYFYIAGNYRDQVSDSKKALENYKIASTLLETSREINQFKAWAFYHTARLQFQNGDKVGAKTNLEKVLKIDGTTADSLEDVKLLASYLLLKIGKS